MEDLHPEVVDYLKGSEKGMLTVFSLADLKVLEDSSNKAGSSGKSLVHKVLEASRIFEDPVLNSSSHF